MSYEFTKLPEVEILDSLTENAHLIVEDGGNTRRFPANQVGKVKTVNGVAPDAEGNIAIEIPEPESVLGEDGKLLNSVLPEGYPYMEALITGTFNGNTYYKVSDVLPERTHTEVTLTVFADGNLETSVGECYYNEESDVMNIYESLVFVVFSDDVVLEGVANFPEKGVYFTSIDDGAIYPTKLMWDVNGTEPDITWDGLPEKTKTLEPKFLPVGFTKFYNSGDEYLYSGAMGAHFQISNTRVSKADLVAAAENGYIMILEPSENDFSVIHNYYYVTFVQVDPDDDYAWVCTYNSNQYYTAEYVAGPM